MLVKCYFHYILESNLTMNPYKPSTVKVHRCVCKKTFIHRQSLQRHKQMCSAINKPKKNFECNRCRKCFNRKDVFKKHNTRCLKSKQDGFSCKVYRKTFRSTYFVKRHSIVHERKHYECKFCSKLFKIQQRLEIHINKYHVQNPTPTSNPCESEINFIETGVHFMFENQMELEIANEDPHPTNPAIYCETFLENTQEIHEDNIARDDDNFSSLVIHNPTHEVEFHSEFMDIEENESFSPSENNYIKKDRETYYYKEYKKTQRIINSIMEMLNSESRVSQAEILKQIASKLDVQEELLNTFKKDKSNAGRPAISLEMKNVVWKFWHDNSVPSTLTSRPAKIEARKRPSIQSDLDYVDTVTTEYTNRKVQLYKGCWRIVKDTYHNMHNMYTEHCKSTDSPSVSYGTFITLKPFYIKHATAKDIEYCVCKQHLVARNCIEALLKIARINEVSGLQFDTYESFFQFLYGNCDKVPDLYTSFSCTPDNSTYCDEIAIKWSEVQNIITASCSQNTTVPFTLFEKIEVMTKKGTESQVIKPISVNATAEYLIDYLDKILSNILYHRNYLKNYRAHCSDVIKSMKSDVIIDLDFSENLELKVEKEPQDLHWANHQITVHSAITYQNNVKTYHPYLSDDTNHDQTFVDEVVRTILCECQITSGAKILIKTDNCCNQYKSAQGFYNLQKIADEKDISIVHIYGVPGHGKSEVDHVGGISKVACRDGTANGEFLYSSEKCVSYLKNKFEFSKTKYCIKEIPVSELNTKRAANKSIIYETVKGSSQFQVILYSPNRGYFKASNRICACSKCMADYGTCELFKTYRLNVTRLNKPFLRSSNTC